LKGLGIDTSTAKPTTESTGVQTAVYPTTPTNNSLISEQTPEVVMTSDRPTDSPFECEGCGS
jgi:hypothetical protein